MVEEKREEFEELPCKPEDFKKWVCEQDEALVLFLPDESDASVHFAAKLSETELGSKLSVVVSEGDCEAVPREEGLEQLPCVAKYRKCERVGQLYFSGDFDKDMAGLAELAKK